MSNYEKLLQRRIDEVLHYIWDPIGVMGEPYARDEYDAYVPHVYSLVQRDAGADEIAAYLMNVVVDRMGLTGTPAGEQRALMVAKLLHNWKDKLRRDRPEILG